MIQSTWKSPACWKNNLHVLDVAVNYAPSANLLQTVLFQDCMSHIFESYVSTALDDGVKGSNLECLLKVVDILKLLLNNRSTDQNIPFLSEFLELVIILFANVDTPSEKFNTLGILYGRLFLNSERQISPETIVSTIESLDTVHSEIPHLARL